MFCAIIPSLFPSFCCSAIPTFHYNFLVYAHAVKCTIAEECMHTSNHCILIISLNPTDSVHADSQGKKFLGWELLLSEWEHFILSFIHFISQDACSFLICYWTNWSASQCIAAWDPMYNTVSTLQYCIMSVDHTLLGLLTVQYSYCNPYS